MPVLWFSHLPSAIHRDEQVTYSREPLTSCLKGTRGIKNKFPCFLFDFDENWHTYLERLPDGSKKVPE